MSTDANQIELIVREVLARIAQPTKLELPAAQNAMESEKKNDELELMANVISVQSIDGKLKDLKQVRVRQQAVVTPAALDMLRAAKVRLVRGAKANPTGTGLAELKPRPAALAVFAQTGLVEILKKQLCPRRALVALADEEAGQVVARLLKCFSEGHRLGVVITESSFDLNMAVNRQGWRGVRIASWSDFQIALREAAPDVWVLDSRQWNIPAINNVCNRIYENGYWRSRKEIP